MIIPFWLIIGSLLDSNYTQPRDFGKSSTQD